MSKVEVETSLSCRNADVTSWLFYQTSCLVIKPTLLEEGDRLVFNAKSATVSRHGNQPYNQVQHADKEPPQTVLFCLSRGTIAWCAYRRPGSGEPLASARFDVGAGFARRWLPVHRAAVGGQ